MAEIQLVAGIDLGTTNSEIAAFRHGQVSVLGPEPQMLPSCVGISPAGALLVGRRRVTSRWSTRNARCAASSVRWAARKPYLWARSGSRPQEISALILQELAAWARRESRAARGQRAIITVPAYFSDAQRNATREAGPWPGLEVLRILNEPTAASLAYGFADGARHTVMVYDLGGGTFDVSIVTMEGEVTEVLSSHGNNRLGGDDFDDLLLAQLEREFQQRTAIQTWRSGPCRGARALVVGRRRGQEAAQLRAVRARARGSAGDRTTASRCTWTWRLSREEYEQMILPLVESTLDSVSKALDDAGRKASELDAILLVGGSTRTPLVSRLLRERTGLEPRQDVHPDLCVALGAGVLASRLGGRDVERVLVDVSPYSFGPSYLGERGGVPYPHCYHPIIRRNTPLPVTRTKAITPVPARPDSVEIQIFQGDEDDALKNMLVGDFRVDGLAARWKSQRSAVPHEPGCGRNPSRDRD